MTVTRMKPVWMGRMRNPVLAQSEGVVPCTSSGTPQYSPLPAPPPRSLLHTSACHTFCGTRQPPTPHIITHHHSSSHIITHVSSSRMEKALRLLISISHHQGTGQQRAVARGAKDRYCSRSCMGGEGTSCVVFTLLWSDSPSCAFIWDQALLTMTSTPINHIHVK